MTVYWAIAFAIVGSCIGSFLNATALRWGSGGSIIVEKDGDGNTRPARSRCLHCGHVLRSSELIPIISFLLQRGRCRGCQKRLSFQYIIVEIVAAVLGALPWAVLWWNSQSVGLCGSRDFICASAAPLIFPLTEIQATAIAVFSWVLLFLFVYDLRYQIILDRVSLPAIVAAIPASIFIFQRTWESIGLGMLISGGIFALQFIISRGKWIGGGDIRMGVLMGALLGLPSTVAALFLTYIIGAAVALYLLATGRAKRDTKIALGTFIAIATVICLYIGDWIANWYLGLLGF